MRASMKSVLTDLWRRLQHGFRRPIPFVPQLAQTDCGPACLAMVLGAFGRKTDVDEIRASLWGGRDGVGVTDLLTAARGFGLRARGVRIEAIRDLALLPRGAVLHWRFHHFVVLDRVARKELRVVDPGVGPRRIRWSEVDRSFTGIALLFEPGAEFEKNPERVAPGTSRRPTWRSFLKPEVPGLARILGSSLLLHGVALAIPLVTGLVVDRVAGNGEASLLSTLALGAGALWIFQAFVVQVRAQLMRTLRLRLDAAMSSRFLEHLMSLPFSFFQGRAHGDLLQRLRSNSGLREAMTSTVLSAVLDGLLVVSYLALLLWFDLRLGAVAAGLGLLQWLLLLATWRQRRHLETAYLEVEARCRSAEIDILGGMETLKAAGAEERLFERWSQLYAAELNATLRRDRLTTSVDGLLDSLRFGAPLVLLLVGATAVLDGRLSLGSMLALNALAMGFLAPLAQLVSSAFQLQSAGSFLERIEEIFRTEPERRGGIGVGPGQELTRLAGGVELCKVSFRYGPRSAWALKDVSLRVEPGSFVALVGPTAAGKSTLAHLLLGLYDPSEGEVFFDDQALSSLDVSTVRRQVAFVPQDPFLFGGTLRSNIALFDPQAPLERVRAAAVRAQIDEEIAAMPLGYDTPVGGAAAVSGGQLQRVVLARALLVDPALLVLDEATSALDTLCEARVQAELESLACTRIVIAHRLSTLRHADQIVVLDEGQVVEVGRHEELLAAGGFYATLLDGQLEGRTDADENADRTGLDSGVAALG